MRPDQLRGSGVFSVLDKNVDGTIEARGKREEYLLEFSGGASGLSPLGPRLKQTAQRQRFKELGPEGDEVVWRHRAAKHLLVVRRELANDGRSAPKPQSRYVANTRFHENTLARALLASFFRPVERLALSDMWQSR